jgi:hypothetical protein
VQGLTGKTRGGPPETGRFAVNLCFMANGRGAESRINEAAAHRLYREERERFEKIRAALS